MQILISYDNSHHTYGDVIGSAIGMLRPNDEVALAPLEALRVEMRRLDPHLVISSQPKPANSKCGLTWVELSPDPDQVSRICVNGRMWESSNPSLEELLAVIDETEMVAGTGREPQDR